MTHTVILTVTPAAIQRVFGTWRPSEIRILQRFRPEVRVVGKVRREESELSVGSVCPQHVGMREEEALCA